MADSNAIAPIFYTAIGGLSDDIFSGIEGSFYDSNNINIRDNAMGISLNKALVKDSGDVILSDITCMLKTSTGKMMAFDGSGNLYWKNTTTWAKITSNNAGGVMAAAEFNGYIYWTTNAYIHRLAISDLDGNITADEEIDWEALNNDSYHPLLVSQGDLYIGNGGRVDKVNKFDVFEEILEINSSDTVRHLDDLGGSIRVITDNGTGNTTLYLWDGVSTAPDQVIPLKGYDIINSIIFNGYNFLITNRGIGILDGYKIYPIKKTTVFDTNLYSFIDNAYSIDVYNEKLYIGGIGGVYVYGNKSKDYPEVLNKAFSVSTGTSSANVGCIFSDGTDLYVSWRDGSTFGIDKLSDDTYYTSGYLTTKGYYANSLYEVKEAMRYILGFKALTGDEEITISYSIDGGSFTEIGTLDSSTDLPDLFTEEILYDTGSFQYIQFKIELSGDGTSTPEFYKLDMVFNNNIKR